MAVVDGGDGEHLDARDLDGLAGGELAHVREPAAAEHLARAARDDHRRALREQAQRRQVEVVVVQVRDQHGVEVARGLRRGRRAVAPQVREPRAQQRVGEQPGAAELDQRVAWPTQTTRLIPRGARRAGRARPRGSSHEPGVDRRAAGSPCSTARRASGSARTAVELRRSGPAGRVAGRDRARSRRGAAAIAAGSASGASAAQPRLVELRRARPRKRARAAEEHDAGVELPRRARRAGRRARSRTGTACSGGSEPRLLGLGGERRAAARAGAAGTPT